MATVGATVGANLRPGAHPPIVAASVHGTWTQVNDDATSATNQSRFNPSGMTASNVHWTPLPVAQATRVLVQARIPIAATSVTATTPSVAVIAAFKISPGIEGDPVAQPTNYRFIRVDSPNIADAATAMAWPAASPSTSNTLNDATYFYSNLPTTTGWDCLGAQYVTVLVGTAGTVSAGAMPIDVLVIN